MTPEFNGDKTEFNMFYGEVRHRDSCDKTWSEILRERFAGVKNLTDFKIASDAAQMDYHSFLGIEILPLETVDTKEKITELSKADEIYIIDFDGNIYGGNEHEYIF
jgi:NMD protein affecting ribosome stability and mRNA decay